MDNLESQDLRRNVFFFREETIDISACLDCKIIFIEKEKKEKESEKDGKNKTRRRTKKKKDEEIDISDLGIPDIKTVSYNFLVDGVIKPRLKEIMSLVGNEIKKSGYTKSLPAGIVITGGGGQTIGLKETARETLNMPVRVAFPEGVAGLIEEIQSPAYAAVTGLVLYGVKADETRGMMLPQLGMGQMKNVFSKVKNWAKSFLP